MPVELSKENIDKALRYLEKKYKDYLVHSDELAKRMGINPNNDLLVIPYQMVKDWPRFDFAPRWILVDHNLGNRVEILRNVRGR